MLERRPMGRSVINSSSLKVFFLPLIRLHPFHPLWGHEDGRLSHESIPSRMAKSMFTVKRLHLREVLTPRCAGEDEESERVFLVRKYRQREGLRALFQR